MKAAVHFKDGLIHYLKDPEAAAEYLNAALAGGDPQVMCIALRNVAEAHGNMSRLAKESHLSRTHLYHITSPRGNPSLASVTKISKALGLEIHFTPAKKKRPRPAQA